MQTALRKIFANLHYLCTFLLAILAVPAVQRLQLPTHLDWRGILTFYWVTLGSRSLLYAMFFCGLAFPLRDTLGPFFARYAKQKLRIAIGLVFTLLLLTLLPLTVALVSVAKGLFVIELAERNKFGEPSFSRRAMRVLAPALYMFVGCTLVIVWNDIIVAERFPVSHDPFLNGVDTTILWGRSISSLSHMLWVTLPAGLLVFLDYAYFQMFSVVGAGLFICAYASYKRGLQFVGACLTAYYIGLLIFYIWPTYGPYVYCQMHAAQFPNYLAAYSLQVGAIRSLQAVSQHKMRYLASGYYISFPSLHVGLPLIAMWLTRNWPRVFWILALYNCIVVVAILTLEWHYAIDLVGGAAVGICALGMVSGTENSTPSR